ncbi:hypothetical protein F2981_18335 (plasmid) [Sinorhizobium meliloti]|nr:hypothetical protein [Sinorhizobium meliloti]
MLGLLDYAASVDTVPRKLAVQFSVLRQAGTSRHRQGPEPATKRIAVGQSAGEKVCVHGHSQ